MVSCFTDKATIVRASADGAEQYTVTEFAMPRIKLLTEGALVNFHESETSATTQMHAGIAIRTSRYYQIGDARG